MSSSNPWFSGAKKRWFQDVSGRVCLRRYPRKNMRNAKIYGISQGKPPTSSHQLTMGRPFISVCSENVTCGTRKEISPKEIKRRSNICTQVSKWGTFPNPVEMIRFCRKPPVVGSGIFKTRDITKWKSNLTMDIGVLGQELLIYMFRKIRTTRRKITPLKFNIDPENRPSQGYVKLRGSKETFINSWMALMYINRKLPQSGDMSSIKKQKNTYTPEVKNMELENTPPLLAFSRNIYNLVVLSWMGFLGL